MNQRIGVNVVATVGTDHHGFPQGFYLGGGGKTRSWTISRKSLKVDGLYLFSCICFWKSFQCRRKNGERQLRLFLRAFILATPGRDMSPAGASFGEKDHINLGN